MYTCNNCGAGLHFDIELQQLKCNHCEQTASVYEVVKQRDGVADKYELNVFECPQCGGKLLSDDTSINEYCSFCGGMTIFSSRISDELMPKEIIPFKVTKEQCHDNYKKHMRKKFYAPKAFRNTDGEKDFRAIYVPYWKFEETQRGIVNFNATNENDKGKSVIKYKADFIADYDDIIFDASSSFEDELGDAIAPFDVADIKEFTPSYLCGFYADIADVPASVYKEDARKAAEEKTRFYIQEQVSKQHDKYKVEDMDKFDTNSDEGNRILLPAWFLAYRKGKRVAYATVNGQSGKVEADLPIDLAKFGLTTVLISVILYGLLNMFFTLKPNTTMAIATCMLAVIMKFYYDEMKSIFFRDHKLLDKGFSYRFKELYGKAKEEESEIDNKRNKAIDVIKKIGYVIAAIGAILMVFNIPIALVVIFGIIYFIFSYAGAFTLWLVAACAAFFYVFSARLYIKKTESVKGLGAVFAVIAILISTCITIANPVWDLYYYIGIFATLIAILISAIDLIHSYNVAATQPLPEFMRDRGGKGDE